jgi:uncharacterized protein (TIGR03083 family)
MNATTIAVQDLHPLDHEEWMVLADVEYSRLLEVVDQLQDSDWSRPTDCTEWDVKAMVGHLLGMRERNADAQEAKRQAALAAEIVSQRGGLRIDALTGLQVAEHAHLTVPELVDALHDAIPRSLAGRRDTPEDARAVLYSPGLPGEGSWTVGYALDVIQTRDPWIHRIDICRAVGRPPELTPDHDGRIVADVVREWSQRHGQSVTLVLAGAAGGTFVAGDGGPEIRLEAVEFCRILSGRAHGDGLLATPVPF